MRSCFFADINDFKGQADEKGNKGERGRCEYCTREWKHMVFDDDAREGGHVDACVCLRVV